MTTAPTISRWKRRFLASGIDGLDTIVDSEAASPDPLGYPQTAAGRFYALELAQAGS